MLATFIGAAFSRRRVVTIWGALLGAILVNALSNGLGLLGVNIFWMGAIKGGLILVVLAASAVRHKGGEHESNHPENLCVGGTDGQQPAGLAVAGRIWCHHPAGHRLFGWANPVFLTVDNWANLLQGSAILLIVAMAMTLIVSAGAIDLSVASRSISAPPSPSSP
ncbi:transmembrane sugar transport protein [Klebsiella pneumoniae]|uniref:Transmembrane sugar transport protein n=1 Tax=Klebsiella pneumoniae TaxID=573 RepID=A0A4P0XYP2_KLEPN|nr:transmembrane sugar transport protein [Klebsiella pneumoniae]